MIVDAELDVTTCVSFTKSDDPADPVDAAVIKPLALTVILESANDPTLLFTVANVVVIALVPLPVTSLDSVIVWSPVLVPLRFDPVTVPTDATDDGVIAPSASVMAGVVAAVATDPLIPFADTTETEVTEPPPTPPVM